MIGVPKVGWVLNYSYVWAREAETGAEEGRKSRPCVLIVSVVDAPGVTTVRVLPISHRPLEDARSGIEIPADTKARLRLDAERSRVICDEGNQFVWPGVDLRPIPGLKTSTVWYGALPPGLFANMRARVLSLARLAGHANVRRGE